MMRWWRSHRLLACYLPLLHQNCQRFLTQNETATALRPFYFAVHPDLFGKFPKERVVNENSLKLLNEYMNNLASARQPLQHRKLIFYIRDRSLDEGAGSFKVIPITISLSSSDLRTTVTNILESCNLSLDYLQSIKSTTVSSAGPDRPLKWHHSYYEYSGKTNPEAYERKPVQSLSAWLRKNVGPAQRLMEAAQPTIEETEMIKQDIITKYGLKDLIWESSWGTSFFSGCIKTFGRLTTELSSKGKMDSLKGQTVIFSSTTGVTLNGDIMLNIEDVPQDWAKFLTSDRNYNAILADLPELERQLSAMLCNIQIVRRKHHHVVMADRYRRQLLKLIHNLQCDTVGIVTGDLAHLQLVVEGAAGPLAVSPRGQILVPNSCPGFLVKNFIQQKKVEAAEILYRYQRKQEEEYEIRSRCIEKLELNSLKKDDHITSDQMTVCCQRLMLEHPRDLGLSLRDLKLRISQYYTLMQDGELIIPWNWKGVSDG